MRRFVTIAFLFVCVAALAQNYPSEWKNYTSDKYFHDIESGATKQTALEQARTNLARQIEMEVKEVSQMDKRVVDGRSNIAYSSSKTFSTDVDMSLTETRSFYDETQGKYYVLVYIDKAASATFYENEVKMLVSKADNVIAIADNYINTGFKQKAKDELQKASQLFDNVGKPFFWLNVFGLDESRLRNYQTQVNNREQSIKQKLSDLEYGTTYCIVCNADLFGKSYAKLVNEVKGNLSASGCNFVDAQSKADVVIHIQASARKYNEFNGAFFTYIDAEVSIDKTATGQRIFEDELQVKGAHTINYDEAARDGYKRISKEITKLLKENIKL